MALGLELRFSMLGNGLTGLDLVGLALAGGMLAMLLGRGVRNLRELARDEPAAARQAP